jgi:acetolactate synthase-1/2/3 large subunit
MTTDKLLSEDIRVSEAIARVLEEAGIDMVFGIIGGDSWMLFDALIEHKDTVRAVTVREESLAGVMAEVYGRLTGRPGVVYGQGAWVISNALLGTLEAHLSSSPMLLMADLTDGRPYAHHGAYQTGAAFHGGYDAKHTLEGVTKRTIVSHQGPEAVQNVQLGIKHALAGERGPVALLFSQSALKSKVGPNTRPPIYPTSRYLDRPAPVPHDDDLRAALATLRKAKAPVIVAGNGVRVSQAYEQLATVAHKLALPVATSGGGKGVFSEVDDLALGVLGTFGRPVANHVVGQADVVLVLGSRLAPPDTANENPVILDPTRQTFIQIDVEPVNTSWTFPVDAPLVGDLAATLARMVELGDAEGWVDEDVHAARVHALTEAQAEHGRFEVEASSDDQSPLLPERLVKVLIDTLPEDAMVTCDAGENRLFMMHLYQTKKAGKYLQSAGVGGMGYAIPAALAAKLVDPASPAVAVCGDGGFGMAMNGLMTALEQDIPIIVVVMNNEALGWVYNGQGERRITAELGAYDYSAISRSMGCEGAQVSTPQQFAEALEKALASDRPWVIDVSTALTREHSFLQVTSPLSVW